MGATFTFVNLCRSLDFRFPLICTWTRNPQADNCAIVNGAPFSIDDNVGFSGTLAAVGASFTGVDFGCNGTFPTFTIAGGKINPSTQ